jgi:hypothetical protein
MRSCRRVAKMQTREAACPGLAGAFATPVQKRIVRSGFVAATRSGWGGGRGRSSSKRRGRLGGGEVVPEILATAGRICK